MANRKNANENTQAQTCRPSALMCHGENYGDNHDRNGRCEESKWHVTHHFFFSSKYHRVLLAFFHKSRHQRNDYEPNRKRRDYASKRS